MANFDPRSLAVRVGDLILPAYNRLLEVLASFRIYAGRGILLTRTPLGVAINALTSASFSGAFFAALSGDKVSFTRGFINAFEPFIGDLPISGTSDKQPPKLTLSLKKYDATGRSWLAVRAQVDKATGKIISPKATDAATPENLKLTMVQVDSLTDPDDTIALCPVAMLYRDPKDTTSFGELHQIRWFDQQHRSVLQNKKWRHFFDPAA